jgi:hypothetical protein
VGVVLGGLQLGLIWMYPSKRQVSDVGAKKHEPSGNGGAGTATSPTAGGGAGSGSPGAGNGAAGSGGVGGAAAGDDGEDVSESAPLAR